LTGPAGVAKVKPMQTRTIDLDAARSTILLDRDSEIIAAQVARGSYQRALAAGTARWSGADLAGKASRYSGRYRDSRNAFVGALRAAGLSVAWAEDKAGRQILVVGAEPFGLSTTYGPRSATAEVVPCPDPGCLLETRCPPSKGRRAGCARWQVAA